MTEISTEAQQSMILGLFKKSSDGKLKAGDLKKKLKIGAKENSEATEVDRAFADLIERGFVAVTGAREGHHPRPNGSYRLTDKGKIHIRPTRPDFSDELLQNQEAFILLQVFRSEEQRLTRSELNAKLNTVTATRQLEFNVKSSPETIEYHLANLVEKNCLDEQRRGISISYSLSPDRGAKELASAKQYDSVSFNMTGKTLNALLKAARGTVFEPLEDLPAEVEEPTIETPTHKPVDAETIAKYIAQLHAGQYAGKDLIPIHEVRRLVADHHGLEAASHSSFDPVLKRMRSEGELDLIAISDGRDATQQEMDDSIPGLNETIFYIVIK